MKNRALLLCMRDKIETAEEYALKIGVSLETALKILHEEIAIPADVVKRNCEIFNVSESYFLCITEK